MDTLNFAKAISKGGLWARGFLNLNQNGDGTAKFGVISLTTLDTPHHGSVLADTVVKFRSGLIGGTIARFQAGFLGAGIDDLTVAGVESLNASSLGALPKAFFTKDTNDNLFTTLPYYYSTSADADRNVDGKIDNTEATPYPTISANLTYQIVARGTVASLSTIDNLLGATISPILAIQNDCDVSISSARYFNFFEINSYVGDSGRNHATIRSQDVATIVLSNIFGAQSAQDDQ